MTVCELYKHITETLQKAGCDSPAFDACCLLEDLAHLPHGRDAARCETVLSDEAVGAVLSAVSRRAAGEPLQYILGQWDFLDLTLEVGKGVLIPRPDTECLCETAAAHLRGKEAPTVLDLCAGSGCVGLGVCSLVKGARVTAVELSDEALPFLRRNARRYPAFDVTVVQDDVLSPRASYSEVDALVSNPPYIPTADLPTLMREVQHEPSMALDGFSDGLAFYRAILSQWLPLVRPGGFVAVEIGYDQGAAVKALFETAGLCDVTVTRDYGGNDRVVYGRVASSQAT